MQKYIKLITFFEGGGAWEHVEMTKLAESFLAVKLSSKSVHRSSSYNFSKVYTNNFKNYFKINLSSCIFPEK